MKNGEVLLIVLLVLAGGAAIYVAVESKKPVPDAQTPSGTPTGGGVAQTFENVTNGVANQSVGSVAKKVASYGLVGITGPIALSGKGIEYVGSGVKATYDKVTSWF